VARIGPAVAARDDTGLLGEEVYDLAFTFVAPLATYDRYDRHGK
jgi:hypothetical protein